MFRRVAGRPAGPAAYGHGSPAATDEVAVPAQGRVWGRQRSQPPAARLRFTPARAESSARSANASFGRHAGWRYRPRAGGAGSGPRRSSTDPHSGTAVATQRSE